MKNLREVLYFECIRRTEIYQLWYAEYQLWSAEHLHGSSASLKPYNSSIPRIYPSYMCYLGSSKNTAISVLACYLLLFIPVCFKSFICHFCWYFGKAWDYKQINHQTYQNNQLNLRFPRLLLNIATNVREKLFVGSHFWGSSFNLFVIITNINPLLVYFRKKRKFISKMNFGNFICNK